ncbi:TPA: hypothetical protein ACH3X1_015318 [Trebouxia sp. C0004]
MCIRYLKGEHADVQLMYLGSISVLGSVVLLVIMQHRTFPTTMPELVLLLLTGCAAYGSQLSQTLALKLVEASLATAMSYLSVVWGMLSGYLVFHEVSNKLSLGGASLVCSCTIVLALAEHLSAAETNQQPVWWHKAWTKLVDWSANCTRRLACSWHTWHRNRALYERVDGNDPDSSN